MSDVPTYGKPDNPFPELPPAASLYSVGWSGTVRWPTAPWSYLDCALDKVSESFVGTASFWVRCNGVLPAMEGSLSSMFFGTQEAPAVQLLCSPGPLVFDIVSFVGDGFTTFRNVPDHGLFLYLERYSGGRDELACNLYNNRSNGVVLTSVAITSQKSVPGVIPSGLIDNAWAHFLVTWDLEGTGPGAAAGSGTLTVNKVAQDFVTQVGYTRDLVTLDDSGFVPAPVAWDKNALFFGGTVRYAELDTEGTAEPPVFGPRDPLEDNHMISFAHVWISARRQITDVRKFVDKDDKPAKFDEDYAVETPSGKVKPDFYFSGGPTAFLENKADGGETTLVGDKGIVQPVPVKIGM